MLGNNQEKTGMASSLRTEIGERDKAQPGTDFQPKESQRCSEPQSLS